VKKVLGLLGWLGLALVVGALVVWWAKPEADNLRRGLALAGLVVTAIYTASQWRDIGRSFGGRNAKYGSIALGGVIVFLGLLIGVNYISNRQNKRWDLTAAKQFSLSDQTKKILTDLKQPVAVKVYYDSDPNTGSGQKQELQVRLDSYRYVTSQLNVEYVDAVKDPAGAKQDSVTSLPTTVFTYNGKSERTTGRSEQDFTNALKKLLIGTTKKVYFVQGHGEHDPEGTDQHTGYTAAASALKGDNFETGKLALAQEGKIPDDASVLIIAGPQTDFLAPEMDMLRAYLKKGGKLFLMIDPVPKFDSPPLTNLIGLAKEWGIDVGNDYVLDQSGVGQMFGAGPQVPIAMNYPAHPITTGFNEMTAYQLARSAAPITGGSNGHTAQAIAQTSARSWAESNLKELLVNHKATPEFDKGDKAGPIALVSAVSAAVTDAPAGAAPDAPKPETRVVVAGDSDFAGNGLLGFQGNRDFFTNAVNWLAQQEDLISIRPRDPEDRRIQLTSDQGERIFYLTVFIIPGLLFLNGIRVWWRRR
jgi:ABC-type uncharacterized transport system involved in gliding motility auxiliary subunit